MKLNKYILGLSVMVAGLLTSCDQDNVSAIYEPTNQNISFEAEGPQPILVKAGQTVEVPVIVSRSISEGSYTAHYSVSGSDVFADSNNGTVTFEPGQTMAVIKLIASGLEGGEVYECTLSLSDADVATADKGLGSQVAKSVITLKADYVWGEKVMGHQQSQFFSAEWDQPMQKAQGFNVYKVLEPFADGLDMIFKINSDNTVEVKDQWVWTHSTYGKVYVVGDYDDKGEGFAGYYYPDDNVVLLYLYWYIPGVGGFGTFGELIYLP